MDTKDKLIGLAMILAGVAFIVLGSAVLVRTNRNVNVYNEGQSNINQNIYNEQQVPSDIYQEI